MNKKNKKTIFYSYHLANVLNVIKLAQKNLEQRVSVFYTNYSYENCLGLLKAGLVYDVKLVSYSSENIKKLLVNRLKIRNDERSSIDKWINKSIVSKRQQIQLYLKYFDEAPLIKDIILYTKPSRQVRVSSKRLKQLANLNPGIIFFISTSDFGVISHMRANELGIGGFLLYKIL